MCRLYTSHGKIIIKQKNRLYSRSKSNHCGTSNNYYCYNNSQAIDCSRSKHVVCDDCDEVEQYYTHDSCGASNTQHTCTPYTLMSFQADQRVIDVTFVMDFNLLIITKTHLLLLLLVVGILHL